MGFPISQFVMLADNSFRRELQDVKLYCVVLHDDEDTRFKKVVTDNFLELDKMTGSKMCFLSFINPPDAWYRRHPRFDCSKDKMMFEKIFDEQQVVHNICNALGSNVPLPCLVTARSLDSNEVWIHRTSPETFRDQMTDLNFSLEPDTCFDRRGARHLLLNESLHDILTSILAVNEIATNGKQGFFYKTALNSVSKMKEHLESRIDDEDWEFRKADYEIFVQKAEEPEEEENSFERHYIPDYYESCIPQGTMLQMMTTHHARDIFEKPSSPFEIKAESIPDRLSLEHDSRSIISNFNEYVIDLNRKSKRNSNEWGDDIEDDYTSPIASLYRVMSNEINASLVQAMRMLYGVEMPDYYMDWKPNQTCFVKTDRRSIYLNNKTNDNEWVGPSLGDAYYGYLAFLDSYQHVPQKFVMKEGEFLRSWIGICNKRNPGEHGRVSRIEDFLAAHSYFMTIVDNYLSQLLAIKKEMRGK